MNGANEHGTSGRSTKARSHQEEEEDDAHHHKASSSSFATDGGRGDSHQDLTAVNLSGSFSSSSSSGGGIAGSWDEWARPSLLYPRERERIVDDFILFCFMVGNDFLPHPKATDISDGGLDRLMSCYKQYLTVTNKRKKETRRQRRVMSLIAEFCCGVHTPYVGLIGTDTSFFPQVKLL